MRITLVSPFDPEPGSSPAENAHVGGVERVFKEISHRLADHGHEVTMLCSTATDPGEHIEEGVRVRRIKRRGTLLRAPFVRLASHLPRDSEIVHVPATYPFTTPGVVRKAKRLGIPTILDFHFEPVVNVPLGGVIEDAYRRVGPRAYPLADRTVVRSWSYGRSAPSLRSVPEERWRIVPNGIDPGRFHPNGPKEEGDYLLFVGRLVPYKGLGVLIEALAKARLDLPLYVVGNGPLREDLERKAKAMGVDVRFLDHVPDGRLPALFRGARLTVLPSVNRQEAFGITLIESMACGTPVVASALPGVKDVAEVGGLVAPPRDADALAEVLTEAVAPGRLERGPPLAKRVHERFSWDAVADRLVEIYEEVLAERRGSAPEAAPPEPVPVAPRTR